MSCGCNNRFENGLKDFGYRMFILLMVFGIIGGGIFSFHGQILGYILFGIGLVCVGFYIYDLKSLSTKNKESK